MTEQEIQYDAIVRTEVAIEILNQARAIVTARIYDLEDRDPAEAEDLRIRRRALLDLQHSLTPANLPAVDDAIAVWGPRGKDEVRFGAEF